MALLYHSKLTGTTAIHPAAYVDSSDPANPDPTVTADDKLWIDTTTGTTFATGWLLKIRDTGNTAWTTILDLMASLALKANLASPTFTGTPAAPTAAGGTNTTQLATTAFVTTAVGAGGIPATIVDVKGDLIAATAADTVARLAAGANGKVLTAASGESTGLIWNALPVELMFACSDESTAIAATGVKLTFRMPFAMTLTSARANLKTASAASGPFTVDIKEGGVTIFSTLLTIDDTELTSTTATASVISDAALADDAQITIEVTDVGDGAAVGLKVTLIGTRA